MEGIYEMLSRVRQQKPVIHHLTNWVTIYDCANIVKVFGASPVMAHAREEVAEMAGIASALVLNIGTLTVDFIEAMKIAAKSANEKGIPVVLDACGAGATKLRTDKCYEIINEARVDIIKGNSSEVARIAGEQVKTKGVDATEVKKDIRAIAQALAKSRKCTVVVTGREDIVTGSGKTYIVKNGNDMMANIVGTGCMAASVIGTFATVEKDLVKASVGGLVCYEIAAEMALKVSQSPGTFKVQLYDAVYALDEKTIKDRMRVE